MWCYTSIPPICLHGVVLVKHRDNVNFNNMHMCLYKRLAASLMLAIILPLNAAQYLSFKPSPLHCLLFSTESS
jgi:hypothetical protein